MKKIALLIAAFSLITTISGQNRYNDHFWLKSLKAVKQRLDSVNIEVYDYNSNQWYYARKEVPVYDANNINTQYKYLVWDMSSNMWKNDYMEDYTYDALGNVIQQIDYEWDDTINQWDEDYKHEFSYDANNNITLFIGYRWDNAINQWVNDEKKEFDYDINGNRSQLIEYDWNDIGGQWIFTDKEVYTYDTSNNRVLLIGFNWESPTNQWINDDKKEFTYDLNKLMIVLDYSWDNTNLLWQKQDKEEYSYDPNGNMTQWIYYEWDLINNQWIITDKHEGSYNNTYNFSDLLLPYWYYKEPEYFTHMLTNFVEYIWNSGLNQWMNALRGTFYYSQTTVVGISQDKTNSIKVYPNPACEIIFIDQIDSFQNSRFELFNIKGETILHQNLHDKRNQISVSHVKSGTYIYQYIQGEKVQRGKIVIRQGNP